MTREQVAILHKAQRMYGMSPGRRAELNHELETKTDWVGRCRVCGCELTGTLKEMRAHKHDASS